MQTRAVLNEVPALVPTLTITELDIVHDRDEAERAHIRTTPTVVILDAANKEVFRAEGVPTLNQVLVAVAKAL
jgi:hypothetical protein